MGDSLFRLKKTRDHPSKQRAQEVVIGTLDSVHQNVVTSMKTQTSNKEGWISELETIDSQITELESSRELGNILHVSRLQEQKRDLEKKIQEEDPLHGYFLKNADLMLN